MSETEKTGHEPRSTRKYVLAKANKTQSVPAENRPNRKFRISDLFVRWELADDLHCCGYRVEAGLNFALGGSVANQYNRWIVTVSLFAVLVLALTLVRPSHAKAQAQDQHPILDKVASKVIEKYQTSTCEQLWVQKSKKAPPSAEEQKAIAFLKGNPQMRTLFIDKVAAPIANKMFECGMIP